MFGNPPIGNVAHNGGCEEHQGKPITASEGE